MKHWDWEGAGLPGEDHSLPVFVQTSSTGTRLPGCRGTTSPRWCTARRPGTWPGTSSSAGTSPRSEVNLRPPLLPLSLVVTCVCVSRPAADEAKVPLPVVPVSAAQVPQHRWRAALPGAQLHPGQSPGEPGFTSLPPSPELRPLTTSGPPQSSAEVVIWSN